MCADDGLFSGEIDPDIADLLGTSNSGPSGPSKSVPRFDDLFEARKKEQSAQDREPGQREAVDLSKRTFAPIEKFMDEPKPIFEDKNFYQLILKGGGERATKVHSMLANFLNAQDPETRSNARMRFIPAWWDFLNDLILELGPRMPMPKMLALRFGVLYPSLITPEQRKIIASVIFENRTGEPIHFFDEWLNKVGRGEITPLAMDEAVKNPKKSQDNSALAARLERAEGQFQAQKGLVQSKLEEMRTIEANMDDYLSQVKRHEFHPQYRDLWNVYNSLQRNGLFNIQEAVKKLSNVDRELGNMFRDLEKIGNEVLNAKQKLGEAGGDSALDSKITVTELNSLRQMCKMSVGRQGNHFPILTKNYMPQRFEDIATRENVLKIMAEVERLDPGLFLRSFKGAFNRIVPHVILLPCYGEFGLCWEPFEKYNRSTSRGRVGIPMYSKNLKAAVLFALGDLRWQVAKEKAGYHWMEEGITGWYYQWFTERGLKGDVRLYFIDDYMLWITKESEGTQKLDKDVRGIFWRNMPFPTEVRESLKNRGFAYSELYKKDINRAMSDGY